MVDAYFSNIDNIGDTITPILQTWNFYISKKFPQPYLQDLLWSVHNGIIKQDDGTIIAQDAPACRSIILHYYLMLRCGCH